MVPDNVLPAWIINDLEKEEREHEEQRPQLPAPSPYEDSGPRPGPLPDVRVPVAPTATEVEYTGEEAIERPIVRVIRHTGRVGPMTTK